MNMLKKTLSTETQAKMDRSTERKKTLWPEKTGFLMGKGEDIFRYVSGRQEDSEQYKQNSEG